AAEGAFDAGKVIIEHVSNSSLDHPLIHIGWKPFGIDLSVTKHVLMLWIVASALFLIVTWTVRRGLSQRGKAASGLANALELVVEFIRDNVVKPNVGSK